MAHFGKYYPMGLTKDFWIFNDEYEVNQWRFPRAFVLRPTGPSEGTLAEKWEDGEFVSDPVELSEGRDKLTYKFQHPDVESAYILYELTWEEWAASEEFSAQNFRYVYRRRYFEDDVEWANHVRQRLDDPNQFNQLSFSPMIGVGGNWGFDPVDPDEFNSIGTGGFLWCALWNEQPDDFHPYRRE